MSDCYRIAVIAGAVWIFIGLISMKQIRIRLTGYYYGPAIAQATAERRRLRGESLRLAIDFVVLLALFLSPFYRLWFGYDRGRYVDFVWRFGLLVFFSLCVSLIVDRILRQKYYREKHIGPEIRRKDFFHDLISMLILSYGITVFVGSTVVAYHAGASVRWQIISSVGAVFLFRSFFLLLRRIRHKYDRVQPDWRNVGIRILQTGVALFFWIRIVLHIEKDDFSKINGISDSMTAALVIITLITAALALIAGLQLLRSEYSRNLEDTDAGHEFP